ncbi:MAG: hypothetical protein ACM3QU_10415 [Verrucomicrobiota bacterium]
MATATERLAAALATLPFAQLPQEWQGGSRLNIPGLSSATQDDPWDALVAASAPGLTGEEVRFAVDESGRTISGGDASPEALGPLVQAVLGQLEAPFWAIAVPDEGDEWSAAATGAEILDLPDAGGDEIEASRVGGALTVRVDGEESDVQLPAIGALLDRQGGDAVVVAHRFAGPVWVAEVFSL